MHLEVTQKNLFALLKVDLLNGKSPEEVRDRVPFDYLTPWLELLYKKRVDDLSEKAKKIRYNLIYYGDSDQGLGTEMANARKPDSGPERETAVKIIRYMQKNKLNTMAEFVDHIAAKWKTITTKKEPQ